MRLITLEIDGFERLFGGDALQLEFDEGGEGGFFVVWRRRR